MQSDELVHARAQTGSNMLVTSQEYPEGQPPLPESHMIRQTEPPEKLTQLLPLAQGLLLLHVW